MGKYIWGRVKTNVENAFYRCEMISDFVSEICDFFSWQSLPIGDHLIPIPWRAWRTRAGN